MHMQPFGGHRPTKGAKGRVRAGLGPYLAPKPGARKEEEREGRRKRRKRKERKERERGERKEGGKNKGE